MRNPQKYAVIEKLLKIQTIILLFNGRVGHILLIIFNDEWELQDPEEHEPKRHKANIIE